MQHIGSAGIPNDVDGLSGILLWHGQPITGGGILLEPLQIFPELLGETDGSCFWEIAEGGQHPVQEQPAR